MWQEIFRGETFGSKTISHFRIILAFLRPLSHLSQSTCKRSAVYVILQSKEQCKGQGGERLVTLAEFELSTTQDDQYRVSIADGFNIPIQIDVEHVSLFFVKK